MATYFESSRFRDPWKMGEEREVSPGSYAKLVSVIADCALWRFETRDGVDYEAGIHRFGGHTVPMGIGPALIGQMPFCTISITDRPKFYLRGSEAEAAQEYRLLGDRFFTPFDQGGDLSSLDGRKVEVFVKSEGESGYKEEVGVLDFTGVAEVIELASELRSARL